MTGSAAGLGQFVQMWGVALMFWWGGYILFNYPNTYSFRDFLISMFALFFSLYGLAAAAQGAVNRDKAKLAANRIFTLIDRQSQIDPLSDLGKKDF
jgi:ATP-binding cassette subfamily B (MDR/TAP) protein 1